MMESMFSGKAYAESFGYDVPASIATLRFFAVCFLRKTLFSFPFLVFVFIYLYLYLYILVAFCARFVLSWDFSRPLVCSRSCFHGNCLCIFICEYIHV